MRLFYLIAFALLISISATAQNLERVIANTNVDFLLKFAEAHEAKANAEKARALQYCEANGLPTTISLPDGGFSEVIGFDESGNLKYAITHNRDAARTISADKVHPYGLVGYNLSGRGFTAGVWDGGRARATHQEFSGRLLYGDNSNNIINHATHVSGTVIAQGINAEAQGMANEGTVRSFDWNAPLSEMATEAAAGLLVSNHSWGYINGWTFGSFSGNTGWHWFGDVNISTTEDYAFGRYDVNAEAWDQLAYNAPFFTIVKSAGNERSDSGPAPGGTHYARDSSGIWAASNAIREPDGDFDCQANMTMSKNMLSVGAVNSIPGGYSNPTQVVPASFTSWGPSDDGRIKPDLVANGVGLLSANAGSNTAYSNSSGTSMSAPTITGSILLLQEHYGNTTNGGLMRSETVRGLLIHTCDEAGIGTGPDYAFGWGLANIEKAARAISDDGKRAIVDEGNLFEGSSITYQVYSDGLEPLKATIAWLDPPASPGPLAVDHRGAMLVNDLDLRIISPSDTTFPWKLDPANPNLPASKGDNLVDNVEVVDIPNPQAGMYTIQISHKDSLEGGRQSYGLIVTGIKTPDSADYCNQLTTFNAYYGQFSDGSEAMPYSENQECNWRINTASGSVIKLSFQEFDLQALADYVRVYDGPDDSSPVIATYSGSNIPSEITSSSNQLYVSFYSDANGTGDQGFLATYAASYCPNFQSAPNALYSNILFGDTCDRIMRFFNSSNNYTSLTWDYGDGNTSNVTAAIHDYSYADGGIYDVTIAAIGKCLVNDTFSTQISIPCKITGLENDLHKSLLIYPNPTEGLIHIEGTLDIRNIEILDIYGKVVLESKGMNEDIDISSLADGYYLIRVDSQDGSLVRRILKTK